MNVLHIISGLPSDDRPHFQPFIKSQIDSLVKKGINVEVMDIEGHLSPLNYIRITKKIKVLNEKKKIDIIHAHYSYCVIPALLARTRLPIVLSMMGSDLLGTPTQAGRMTLRGNFDINLSKYLAKKVNYVIVKSDQMEVQLKYGVKVQVIPNGVDFDFFKPENKSSVRQRLEIDENEFLILFLGDPNEYRKNFNLAKESINKFKSEYNNKVKLLNPFGVSQEEIVDYLNASDVLLLTSYWEGSPNVVKEAMACNLPIISTDVGDVKKIIDDTINCFIVPFSSDAIVEKLSIISKNRVQSNGRSKIGYLRDDIIADKIINLYNSILT